MGSRGGGLKKMSLKKELFNLILIFGGINLIWLADRFMRSTFLEYVIAIVLTVIGAGLLIYYGRRTAKND